MTLFNFDGFVFTDEFDPEFPGYRKQGKTKEYIPLHNYVYWQHTGLIPKKGKTVIHHIDGKRENNDFKNLELITTNKHGKIHIPHDFNCTMSKIGQGKGLFGYSGTRYKHKTQNPWTKVWTSKIQYNGKQRCLGYFHDPLSCEIVYRLVWQEIYD